MAVERKLPGWGFWGRWVLVSAVGFGLGAFLGMSLAWATVGVVATGSEVTPAFFSMAYLDVQANGTYEQWHDLKYSAIFAPGGEFILYTVAMVVGGLMQWLVLRRHVGWARWWALPVPLIFAYYGLTDPTPLHVGGGVTLIAFYAKDFGIGGALYSMLVGIPLVWLLRRSYRKARSGADSSPA